MNLTTKSIFRTRACRAVRGYILRQQASDPQIAAQTVRRPSGLFFLALMTCGAMGGPGFGPMIHSAFGVPLDSARLILGAAGLAGGFLLALLYRERYRRAANAWPWLCLSGGAYLSSVLVPAAVMAGLYGAAFVLGICMLRWLLPFFMTMIHAMIFRSIFRR